MPMFMFDDINSGTATEAELGWEQMPRAMVQVFADEGDTDAQAWLDANPPPPLPS